MKKDSKTYTIIEGEWKKLTGEYPSSVTLLASYNSKDSPGTTIFEYLLRDRQQPFPVRVFLRVGEGKSKRIFIEC